MTACATCGADPCINPSFCRACRDADRRNARGVRAHHAPRGNNVLIVETPPADLDRLRRLMRDSVSLDRASDEINRAARELYDQAPKATYDAVVHELRTYGLPQLSKPNCQRRLSDLSAAQIKTAMASLQVRRNQYPKVNDELLKALARIYSEKVGGDG